MSAQEKFRIPGLAFWRKPSGNYCSNHRGLSKEDVDLLQDLKAGDRLIIWAQNGNKESDPHFVLKRFAREGEPGFNPDWESKKASRALAPKPAPTDSDTI